MNRLQQILISRPLTVDEIAGTFDHALLAPVLTDREMRIELRAIRKYPLASVCIKPAAVALAIEELGETEIAVCTVIGFPQGSNLSSVKAFEAEQSFKSGAKEVDMVVNIGKVLGEDWDYVRSDVKSVFDVTRAYGGILKVIFETDYVVADRLKIRLCEICSELKVDYVKTSTGFGFVVNAQKIVSYSGATEHDVRLMREHCPPEVGIKASGGIRSLESVLKYIELGCTRIGLSASKSILELVASREFDAKSEHSGY